MNRHCYLFIGTPQQLRGHIRFLKDEAKGRIKDTVPIIVSQETADFLSDFRFIEPLVFEGEPSSIEDARAWAKRMKWKPTVLEPITEPDAAKPQKKKLLAAV